MGQIVVAGYFPVRNHYRSGNVCQPHISTKKSSKMAATVHSALLFIDEQPNKNPPLATIKSCSRHPPLRWQHAYRQVGDHRLNMLGWQ
jgi:hypothetical protein